MSKKQMEKELNYGDSNNLLCFFGNIFKEMVGADIKVDKKENSK
jgi:hypothetical protein